MRTYLYFFFGILVVNLFYLKHMYCQNSGVDTATVILNAKINILALETSIKSTEEIKNIMDSDIKYEILESKGFNEDVIFFRLKMEPRIKADTSNYFYSLINQYDSDFIFAFCNNNQKYYRLKGFSTNDFMTFYNDMIIYIDYSVASSTDTGNRKQFLSTFYIEDINLDCLYGYLSKKRKHHHNCLKPNNKIFSGT